MGCMYSSANKLAASLDAANSFQETSGDDSAGSYSL